MKKFYRTILLLMSAAATALCALPIVSAHSGGTESCDLIVRGYNLMEFSALGSVCLFAPLLVLGIMLGNQSRVAQEVELMCLLLGNIVCYTHSVNAARVWLMEVCTSLVKYHINMLLYPIAFIALILFGWAAIRFSTKDIIPYDEEEIIEE